MIWGGKDMPVTALEARIARIENVQSSQASALADLKTKQEVQTEILNQHTTQNNALLRDQRQVITTVTAIESIIKTGSIIGAMIKWISGVAIAIVSIYAIAKMVQSGDFSAIFRLS